MLPAARGTGVSVLAVGASPAVTGTPNPAVPAGVTRGFCRPHGPASAHAVVAACPGETWMGWAAEHTEEEEEVPRGLGWSQRCGLGVRGERAAPQAGLWGADALCWGWVNLMCLAEVSPGLSCLGNPAAVGLRKLH